MAKGSPTRPAPAQADQRERPEGPSKHQRIRLTDAEWAEFVAVARAQGVTASKLLAKIVRAYLTSNRAKNVRARAAQGLQTPYRGPAA